MMPLDPTYLQMFPSVARYLKRARRERILVIMVGVLSLYIVGRDLLRAYQEGVATTHMIELPGRVNNLEVACQRDHPKRSLVTAAQAQVIVTQRERARTP